MDVEWMLIGYFIVSRQSVTAIKLSIVGAGHARDEGPAILQSPRKYRGRGPLLQCLVFLTQWQ
jgi:hypothetical protein